MFKLLNKLENVMKLNSSNIAYKLGDSFITYNELWNCANKLAFSLKCQGTSPVLLYGHKSINMIISIIACLIANRAYIPIDLHVPHERIKKIIKLSKSTLLIKNEEISIDKINCMTVDEINNNFENSEIMDTSENNIAYIIFTSGSTGEPKGVPISYDNLENFINWILKVIKLENDAKVMNQASFSFDLSVTDLYYSLFNGYTLIALTKEVQVSYDPIFNILNDEKIDLMVITPTFMKLLLLNKEFEEKNFANLKSVYFCGETLEVSTVKSLFERFPKLEVINAYGPTEATSAVSAITITSKMLSNEYLPVGSVYEAATNIEIKNHEIVLSGKSVFGGYINKSTKKCFKIGDVNYYKTGDIGKIENDLLYCFGRKDNQIKYMGYRIELGDIERNLAKVDGINEAVVIAKYKENTKIVKSLKAFITISKEVFVEDIKKELSKTLPSYMIPKNIVILDKIPVNENGKCDRKRLSDL